MAFSDGIGRKINYLRLSITDRCNLNCIYCNGDKRQFIPHQRIISYEELERFVAICVKYLGIQKIRLTGGEPFARRGCLDFIARLHQANPNLDLRVTSNGTLLEPYIPFLREHGIKAVNLSLDSFDPATFQKITGHDLIKPVLASLDKLLEANIKVKINAVGLYGYNDQQMADFVHAAKTLPIDVRFIEFMPMGSETIWSESKFWSAKEMLETARQFADLEEDNLVDSTNGPAKMYRIANAKGRLGFITAISCHFCNSCNRLRLTSDGCLRTCLFADQHYPLRHFLKDQNCEDAKIASYLKDICQNKPIGADLLKVRKNQAVAKTAMVNIGG